MKRLSLGLLIAVVLLISLAFVGASSIPNGATLTPGTPERGVITDAAGRNDAQAGNITLLNIEGRGLTQAWQGYFGNVSGTVQLSDAANHIMYNWSLTSPQGEIYASVNDSLSWSKIECFNFTASGALTDDSATQAGNQSLTGMNLTQLEARYNITSGDADTVNATFPLLGSGHKAFNAGNLKFGLGQCQNTRVYDSTGKGVGGNFEEVLLYEPAVKVPVFTSLLNNDVSGFDQDSHDFEMLVLENGHNADTTATPYFFYVELQ